MFLPRRSPCSPRLAATLLAVAAVSGCRLVHMDALEIVDWTPKASVVEEPEHLETIGVTFSAQPDKPRAERAFALTADNEPLSGRFDWDGTTLRFLPDMPLDGSADYLISVTGEAEDIYGNALARDFEHSFTTRRSSVRPRVVETIPGDGGTIAVEGASLDITFSERVQRERFYESFSLSPAAAFSVSWSQDDSVVSVHPMEALTRQQEYTVRLGSDLQDQFGNSLAEPFEITVRAEAQGPEPVLLEARASFEPAPETWRSYNENDEPLLPLFPAEEGEMSVLPAEGWERFWAIELEFDVPVRRDDLVAAVSFDPDIAFSITPHFREHSDVFVLTPDERFAYGRDYTLRIAGSLRSDLGVKTGISEFARFSVNGAGSRPPEAGRVFFLEDVEDERIAGPLDDDDELDLAGYAEAALGFFDLYVSTAEGARIGPFNVAEHISFAVENIAAEISLANVVVATAGEFAGLDPGPARAPQPDEHIVRVFAEIEDLENAGLVTLLLAAPFADTFDNQLPEAWQLRLNQVSSR